ncbi:TPA: hypothetical protein ACH95L_002803 [Staphylococcus aureus]
MDKKTIYFICTGNSCRSQMAEGWGKEILGEGWNVYSAGIETHGVNPKAIEAMKKEHWGFDDPAGKEWSEFQRVRDEIKLAIEKFKLR